ncbi:MAG: hypothetical protein GXP63_05155 [DPANN group archaeon]|nr:hypothetical protein [DPANN group archaeon]
MAWSIHMWSAFKDIARSPFILGNALWLLIPVIILWIIYEIYFDLHKKEPLGWNSALGNGVSMFWIGINLMTFLFNKHAQQFTWERFTAVSVIITYSLFIIYISFFHKMGAKKVFLLASPTPIYFISFVTIVWAYGSLTMTWWVFLDLLILFPLIIGLEMLFRKYAPSKDDADEGTGTPELSSLPQNSGQASLPEEFKF